MGQTIYHIINSFNESTSTLIPNSESILSQLLPNVWVFIAHCLAFLIMVVLMIVFMHKPTQKYIEKRAEIVQKALNEAEKNKHEAAKNLEEANQKLLEAKLNAADIIEKANLDADKNRQEIEANAKLRAELIIEEGQQNIQKQENELSNRMNLEVTKLALETAEIFMQKKMDNATNQKMIDGIIADLTNEIEKELKELEDKENENI